jgi:hypothetical protein
LKKAKNKQLMSELLLRVHSEFFAVSCHQSRGIEKCECGIFRYCPKICLKPIIDTSRAAAGN